MGAEIKVKVETVKKKDGIWNLTFLHCPFCGHWHTHGGGSGARPLFGYRVSHCVNISIYRGYELVKEKTTHRSLRKVRVK